MSSSLVGCCFTSTETIGLLGSGAQDGHRDFHTAPELCVMSSAEALPFVEYQRELALVCALSEVDVAIITVCVCVCVCDSCFCYHYL